MKNSTLKIKKRTFAKSSLQVIPSGNKLITVTIQALDNSNDAQNKCPLYCPSLTSLFFGIFPSLRGGHLILVVATGLTWGKYH